MRPLDEIKAANTLPLTETVAITRTTFDLLTAALRVAEASLQDVLDYGAEEPQIKNILNTDLPIVKRALAKAAEASRPPIDAESTPAPAGPKTLAALEQLHKERIAYTEKTVDGALETLQRDRSKVGERRKEVRTSVVPPESVKRRETFQVGGRIVPAQRDRSKVGEPTPRTATFPCDTTKGDRLVVEVPHDLATEVAFTAFDTLASPRRFVDHEPLEDENRVASLFVHRSDVTPLANYLRAFLDGADGELKPFTLDDIADPTDTLSITPGIGSEGVDVKIQDADTRASVTLNLTEIRNLIEFLKEIAR